MKLAEIEALLGTIDGEVNSDQSGEIEEPAHEASDILSKLNDIEETLGKVDEQVELRKVEEVERKRAEEEQRRRKAFESQ